MPKEYIPGVAKGLESIMSNGVLAGFPVIGCKATLMDGQWRGSTAITKRQMMIRARLAIDPNGRITRRRWRG